MTTNTIFTLTTSFRLFIKRGSYKYYQQSRQIMKEAKFNYIVGHLTVLCWIYLLHKMSLLTQTPLWISLAFSGQTKITAPTNTTSVNKLVTKWEVLQQSCKTFDLATSVTIRGYYFRHFEKGEWIETNLWTMFCKSGLYNFQGYSLCQQPHNSTPIFPMWIKDV